MLGDADMKTLAWLGLSFGVAIGALAACSLSDGGGGSSGGGAKGDASGFERDGSTYDSAPSPDSGLGELLFRPDTIYSGVDGTHTFKMPIAVYDGASDLTVTASDPSAVVIEKTKLANPTLPDGTTDNGSYFMLTAKKAGTFTLTATSKGRSTTATVTVAQYASTRWQIGQTRYMNGGAGEPPCADCHVNGQAIDHSPASMASVDDEALAAVITTGIKPNNTPVTGVSGGHRWKVTTDERDGLVTYLRALTPKGFQ
jgi:hypothetical protein